MDDCLDFLTLQVRVLVPYAPNEIGPNHAKFPIGRVLAGIGSATHLDPFDGRSVAETPVGNPVDAESWNAQTLNQTAVRQITMMATVIAPVATYGTNRYACRNSVRDNAACKASEEVTVLEGINFPVAVTTGRYSSQPALNNAARIRNG